jgi:polyisoprenoid-binding protein YceI
MSLPLLAILLGVTILAVLPVAACAADQYKIDTVHSSLVFRIKHLNVGYFYGRFNDLSGSVLIDEDDPAKSVFDVLVKADSVDTANAKRDGHLKSPDFLNVKEFPTMTFKSKEVKLVKAQTFEVTGDFTLHGVTKSIKVQVRRVGSGKDPFGGGTRTGFETDFTIRRSDYSMGGMPNALSDYIWLLVGFEAVKK